MRLRRWGQWSTSCRSPATRNRRTVVSGEAELVRVTSVSSGIGEFWEFEDWIPSYDDSFQLGAGDTYGAGDEEGQYMSFGYSDTGFGPLDLLGFRANSRPRRCYRAGSKRSSVSRRTLICIAISQYVNWGTWTGS
ncbi:hypothetical protein NL676_036589 [Syzygium grande]|nr:hypothetical protein NL676_036589 [Syzygium grande]